jgi:hypothetical protein
MAGMFVRRARHPIGTHTILLAVLLLAAAIAFNPAVITFDLKAVADNLFVVPNDLSGIQTGPSAYPNE